MSFVSSQQIREKLRYFSCLRELIEKERHDANGRLPRHEWWRLDYYNFPYLAGTRNELLSARFEQVFLNVMDMNSSGQIIPKGDLEDDTPLISKFTHLLEEWNSRGGLPIDVIQSSRRPILRYFENGDPIGLRLFAGYRPPVHPFLVKYSQREYLEELLNCGSIRVCPASYYNSSSHLESVRDNERRRQFFIPTFRERNDGKASVIVRGREIRFGDDDLTLTLESQDYFLYSLCTDIYYRLSTDFNANAALIIRDPARFSRQLVSAILERYPDFQPHAGSVFYFDPYRDYDRVGFPEMTKHFGYSYQREYRFVFRPKQLLRRDLQPEFLSIGSLREYADLVTV